MSKENKTIDMNRGNVKVASDNLESTQIRQLIHCMSDGVLMFDTGEKVVITNPAMTRMAGLPEAGFYLHEFIRLFDGKIENMSLLKRLGNRVDLGGYFVS